MSPMNSNLERPAAPAKRRRFARTGLAALLVVTLSAACIPHALALSQEGGQKAANKAVPASSAQAAAALYEKSEIVYANLAATGTPQAVYVVNRFDVAAPGTLVDHGDYTDVKNLTNESDLVRSGDVTTVDVEEGVFYYQGDAAQTTLPWNIALSYELDGKPISADELAGASGALAIRVTTTRNAAVDPAFYDSFMLQITFTLKGQESFDVQAEGATIASAGQDWTVAFTALPGHDGDFTLKAQVSDFSMDGVQIAALPYSSVVDLPDTGEMTDGMADLASAVSQLTDGTAQLADGIDLLAEGAQGVSEGAEAFGQGLSKLDGGSSYLVSVSGDIRDALAAIASGLAGADLGSLADLERLPATLRQLADGLDGSGGLRESVAAVQQGYAQALGVLDGAIGAIPAGSIDEAALGSLVDLVKGQGTEADAATLGQLTQYYAAAQYVRGAYVGPNGNDGAKAAFDGASALLDNLAADASSGGALATSAQALRAMADALESSLGAGALDQLPALVEGLSGLSGEYGRFHDGLAEYASGLSSLSSKYQDFASGASQFAGGAGDLVGGANDLSDGMSALDESTATLPETMREKIGEMTAEFDFPEFEPVSFVSSENANVNAVQFVMATSPIEKPEAPQEEEAPAPEPTLWDRLLALFQG